MAQLNIIIYARRKSDLCKNLKKTPVAASLAMEKNKHGTFICKDSTLGNILDQALASDSLKNRVSSDKESTLHIYLYGSTPRQLPTVFLDIDRTAWSKIQSQRVTVSKDVDTPNIKITGNEEVNLLQMSFPTYRFGCFPYQAVFQPAKSVLPIDEQRAHGLHG